MSYAERSKKLSSSFLRSTNLWEVRPAIIPTAIYTPEEAAMLLALSKKTLYRARHAEGEHRLRCAKLDGAVRFSGEELLRWFKAHEAPSGA